MTKTTTTETGNKNENSSSQKIVIVLVRGTTKMPFPVKDTLQMLRLTRKNYCVVVENNPIIRGMLQKVKDYVTWGEITADTFAQLLEKRGKEYKARLTDAKQLYTYKVLESQGKKYKPYFALNPPRKGFGRHGVKVSYKNGGALGYRGEKINDLLQRML